jgi:ankyrin repeat protein
MSDLRLIEAVKAEDVTMVKELIESGSDINQQDEQGWTLLSWSAAKGDAALVSQLLEKGTDVFKTGRDQRTPYMIALAAGHIDIAKSLKKAMERRRPKHPSVNERQYCRAYFLKELREFAGWSENGFPPRDQNESAGNTASEQRRFSDTDVVFLHQDLSVTASMRYGADIIFNHVTPAWTEFTGSHLKFSALQITDLLT